MAHQEPQHVHVAIAGSGFAGLGTAIRLKQKGIHDFLVFERANDVGGVWRDNSYPGCACDVQSHLYSFSFARNPDWSRSYSPQAEIQAYLRACAERFGILPHLKFGHELREVAWDGAAQRWRIETSHGRFTADVLVAGVGALSEPAVPKLAGLETFLGKVFHSSRWDHAHDLTGKKIAVIGTGASAIQFVPRIQPRVGKLSVFQRTPPWVLPRRDRALSPRERRVLRGSALAQRILRGGIYALRELTLLSFTHPKASRYGRSLALRHLRRSVPDAALRAKLTPAYALGCKRVLLSDDYLPALTQPNVDVVTDAIEEIRPRSIVTQGGVEHEVDTIIFGTGFQIQEYPFARRVRGRDGKTLAETWRTRMTAHLGTTVSGYPNLFLLQGPNTGLGHTSVITMIESQIEHVVNAIGYMRSHGIGAVEPRAEAQEAFVTNLDRKMEGTVWTAGGCASWYLDRRGNNSALWPGFTFTFKRRVEAFRPSEYVLTAALVEGTGGRAEKAQNGASAPVSAHAPEVANV